MSNEVTTVTLPRALFEKVSVLAKREHRSTRGQIMHILATATAGIELADQTHTQREAKAAADLAALFDDTDDIDYATGLPKR